VLLVERRGAVRRRRFGGRRSSRAVLCEALYLQILSYSKEGIEFLLGHIDLAMVDEVKDGDKVGILDPFEVEEWMFMTISPKYCSEEWGAGRQDDLVSLDLVLVASEGDIEKVLVFTQFSKSATDVGFKVVPAKTKLFTGHFGDKRFLDLY